MLPSSSVPRSSSALSTTNVRNFKTRPGDSPSTTSRSSSSGLAPISPKSDTTISSSDTEKNDHLDQAAQAAILKFQLKYSLSITQLRKAFEKFGTAEETYKKGLAKHPSTWFCGGNAERKEVIKTFEAEKKVFEKVYRELLKEFAPAVNNLLQEYREKSEKSGFLEFGPHDRGEAKLIAICFALIFGENYGSYLCNNSVTKRKIDMRKFEDFYFFVTGFSLSSLGSVKGYVEHGYFARLDMEGPWEFYVSDEERHADQSDKFIKTKRDGGYGTIVQMFTENNLKSQSVVQPTSPAPAIEIKAVPSPLRTSSSLKTPTSASEAKKEKSSTPLISLAIKLAQATVQTLAPRKAKIAAITRTAQTMTHAAVLNRLCDRATNRAKIVQFCDKLPENLFYESNTIKISNKTIFIQFGVTVQELKNLIQFLNQEFKDQSWFTSIIDTVEKEEKFIDSSPIPFIPDHFFLQRDDERVGKILLSRVMQQFEHTGPHVVAHIVSPTVDEHGNWMFPMVTSPDGTMKWPEESMLELKAKEGGGRQTDNSNFLKKKLAREHAAKYSSSIFTAQAQETLDKFENENQLPINKFQSEIRTIISQILHKNEDKFIFEKPDAVKEKDWPDLKNALLMQATNDITAAMWDGVDHSSKPNMVKIIFENLQKLLTHKNFEVSYRGQKYVCSILNCEQLMSVLKIGVYEKLLPDTWKIFSQSVKKLKVFVGQFLVPLAPENRTGTWQEAYVFALPPVLPGQDDPALSMLGVHTSKLPLKIRGDARHFHAISMEDSVRGKTSASTFGLPGASTKEIVDGSGHSYLNMLVVAALALNGEKLPLPAEKSLETYEELAKRELVDAKRRANTHVILDKDPSEKLDQFFDEYQNLQRPMDTSEE